MKTTLMTTLFVIAMILFGCVGCMYRQARIDCVDQINAYRATLNLPPLERWTGGESCADKQAEADFKGQKAHANFSMCGDVGAQNTCPNYGSTEQANEVCIKQMFDEGPPPGRKCKGHGHYVSMTNTYTKVACGFYTDPKTGKVWVNHNFFGPGKDLCDKDEEEDQSTVAPEPAPPAPNAKKIYWQWVRGTCGVNLSKQRFEEWAPLGDQTGGLAAQITLAVEKWYPDASLEMNDSPIPSSEEYVLLIFSCETVTSGEVTIIYHKSQTDIKDATVKKLPGENWWNFYKTSFEEVFTGKKRPVPTSSPPTPTPTASASGARPDTGISIPAEPAPAGATPAPDPTATPAAQMSAEDIKQNLQTCLKAAESFTNVKKFGGSIVKCLEKLPQMPLLNLIAAAVKTCTKTSKNKADLIECWEGKLNPPH